MAQWKMANLKIDDWVGFFVARWFFVLFSGIADAVRMPVHISVALNPQCFAGRSYDMWPSRSGSVHSGKTTILHVSIAVDNSDSDFGSSRHSVDLLIWFWSFQRWNSELIVSVRGEERGSFELCPGFLKEILFWTALGHLPSARLSPTESRSRRRPPRRVEPQMQTLISNKQKNQSPDSRMEQNASRSQWFVCWFCWLASENRL